MTSAHNHSLWCQRRRICEAKGRLEAIEDIRLRLIEMDDADAATNLSPRIDRLRSDLEYQQRMLVAMQARVAVRRPAQAPAVFVTGRSTR